MKPKFLLISIITIFLVLSLNNILASVSISNCTELQDMNLNLSGNYLLSNNIDCSDTINWNTNEGFMPIGNATDQFTGTFDGQGYNITDLYINRSSNANQGLFGKIQNSQISNVRLINTSIKGGLHVGSLIGYSINSNIINCLSITGNIESEGQSGGLIGRFDYGRIDNSYSDINIHVFSNGYGGGLVGIGTYSSIVNSSADGNVFVGSGSYAGGLSGDSYGDSLGEALIENCSATGNVSSNIGNFAGGLTGYNEINSTIRNSYATGNVSGGIWIGGLAGENDGYIFNSYSIGNVNGDTNVGGLTGENYYDGGTYNVAYIENCYSVGNVIGNSNVGGFVGLNENLCVNSFYDNETSGQTVSACGTGKTTAEMMQQSTFTNWDFTSIWDITPSTYPCLQFNCLLYPPSSPIVTPIPSTAKQSQIYKVMESAGSGIGSFIGYLTISLPALILGLAIIGALVSIFYVIVKRIVYVFK